MKINVSYGTEEFLGYTFYWQNSYKENAIPIVDIFCIVKVDGKCFKSKIESIGQLRVYFSYNVRFSHYRDYADKLILKHSINEKEIDDYLIWC